jgi:hypothetical protein
MDALAILVMTEIYLRSEDYSIFPENVHGP